MNLQNRNVLLTGANGGLGEALAHDLSRAGAHLLLVGRDSGTLRRLCDSLPHNHHHRVLTADITRDQDRENIVRACRDFGPLHVLINNAAVSEFDLLEQQSEMAIMRVLSTNLLAPMLLTRLLLPLLALPRESAIVNVGSSFGSIGYPGFTSYCASKFGLRGFSEALRRELSDTSIKVHYVAPRAIKTRLNKAAVVALNQALGNRMDTPEMVARSICRSLDRRLGRDIFIGWPEKLFVRINSLWPALVDGSLRRQLHIIRHFAGKKIDPAPQQSREV